MSHHQRVLMLDQGEKSFAGAKVTSSLILTIALMIVSDLIDVIDLVILFSRIKERKETNFCSVFVFNNLFVVFSSFLFVAMQFKKREERKKRS